MNDDQLPKPSRPNQADQTAGQVQPQQTQVADDADELPPPSAMRQGQGEQQLVQGQTQQVGVNPTQPSPQPAQTPVQAQSVGQPQPQPQQQSQLGSSALPPTSLSALSSMSSTQLPENDQATQTAQSQPQAEPQRQGGIRAQSSLPQSPKPEEIKKEQPPKKQDPSTNNPKFAEAKAKKPIFKYLPFIGGGLLVLLLIVVAAMKFLGGSGESTSSVSDTSTTNNPNTNPNARTTVSTEQTTIEYWGLWEPNEVMQEIIADFEEQNPGITVNYVKQSHKDYRQRLQTAIASGNGPDLFRYHASWVPMLADELAPVPSSVISASEFKQTYYPVAAQQLQSKGQIVGIPAMYDGLALLYNKEIFTAAGEQPPTSWADIRMVANKLTVRSGDTVTRGGIALGVASNVDHYADILAVLILQNGGDLSQPDSAYTRDALKFYTNFFKEDKVWSETLPNSTVAFARGDVAMTFAPSWRIHEILAMNPNIDLGVAPLPALGEEKITWATYWAEGLSDRSKNKEASSAFLKHLTSKEALQKFYSSASKVRAFGEIYPRVDMADTLADEEYVAPYLEDAPSAQGWYLSSATHDNGINDLLIKYYEDAINAIIHDGKKAENVLSTVEQGTKQVLRQYGVSSQSQ